jgi:two-component system LytT family response regulator
VKVLLVDDERLARLELRRLLAAHPVEVAGEADNVADALALTAATEPDLVFLDVQMRGESGFDFLERVPAPGPRVVLVTAHDGFAVRGFECNVLDYLLKPVRPERLAHSLGRWQPRPPAPAEPAAGFTWIRAAGASRLVPWRDIRCISAEGNYTRVALLDGSSCLVLRTLKDWLAHVPAASFEQVHRAHLVRLECVREVRTTVHGDHELVLTDLVVVPVGRTYRAQLRMRLAGLGEG